MNQPDQPRPAAPAGVARNTTMILGTLAALFAGGLFLLYAMTGGDGGARLAEQAAPEAARAEPRPQDQPGPQPAVQSGDFATSAELAALQGQLAEARTRIDSLSERASDFADTQARIDALEARISAAKAAADAAATRADEVARQYTALTGDYARLGAQFTPEGVLIRLDETALAFPPGSSALPAEADAALAEIADFLAQHPGQRATLRGHTDATGSADANLALSEERAAAVQAALVGLGIAPERLRIEGAGAAEPIADNASADGRSRNRRVDILLSAAHASAG